MTISRSLLAGGALMGALALGFNAATAHANHTYVFAVVSLLRGSQEVAGYGSQNTTCTGTSCAVTVALGTRDYGRFVKWCGTASLAITVNPGDWGHTVKCAGPSPWELFAGVVMRDSRDYSATHAEAVTITVNVTR